MFCSNRDQVAGWIIAVGAKYPRKLLQGWTKHHGVAVFFVADPFFRTRATENQLKRVWQISYEALAKYTLVIIEMRVIYVLITSIPQVRHSRWSR